MQGGDSCLVTSRNPPAGKEEEACPPVSGTAGVRGDVDRAPTPGRQQVGGPKLEYVVPVPLAASEPGRHSSECTRERVDGLADEMHNELSPCQAP